MTKLQKNNKDIYYHNLIQRLQKTSAIVSHIVGLENITGDITQIPIINEWYNQMNDNLPFEFTNLLEALPPLLNQSTLFGLVNVTYDELLTKVNNSELEPGTNYLITDFRTVHHILDNNTSRTDDINTGELEPLIVKAVTINELDKEAISIAYPKDVIYYSITSDIRDIAFYNDDQSPVTDYKGQIYFRHDTIQNVSTWYDFRNVKFRRWAVDAELYEDGSIATYTGFVDGMTTDITLEADNIGVDGNSISLLGDGIKDVATLVSDWNTANPTNEVTLTAGDDTQVPSDGFYMTLEGGVNPIAYIAKDVCKSGVDGKIYKCIADTTGEGDPTVNTTDWVLWLDKTINWSWTSDKALFNVGDITTDNLTMSNPIDLFTFGDYYEHVKDVHIGRNDLSVLIGFYGIMSTLNNIVVNTVDGIPYMANTFGEICFNNTIGNTFYSNTIGNNFYSNTIGNEFSSNTIGNDFHDSAIGNNFDSNTIGDYFRSNTIGNSFQDNTIENDFYSNTIGDSFKFNTIGNYFGNNQIADYFGTDAYSSSFGNNIGDYFQNNTTLGTFADNKIGNMCGGSPGEEPKPNTFGDGFKFNTIGNIFQDNTIGNDFSSNTIGDTFISNTIGEDFSSNNIENDFKSNTIGDSFNSNTIGNYFHHNNIGSNFDSNTIGNGFGANNIGYNFNSNTIGKGFNSNTIGNGFGANNIGSDFSFNTIGNYFRYNTIKLSITEINFTSATHVYQPYDCEIFKRSDGDMRLRYTDSSDAILTVAPTD